MIASAPNFSRTLAGAASALLFATICIGGATAPATAATTMGANADGQRTMTVVYADLDLGSPAGRNALNSRIRDAARKVCANTAATPAETAYEYQCVAQAMKAGQDATIAAVKAARTTG
jgi:UrcA family protein